MVSGMSRPRFDDLTEAEKSLFDNGVGPYWFPDWLRRSITKLSSWFFREASWRHHDFGYAIGFTWRHRLLYDWKFLGAMARDALSQDWSPKTPVALVISSVLFIAVVLGGWGSFHFGTRYRTVEDILDVDKSLSETLP